MQARLFSALLAMLVACVAGVYADAYMTTIARCQAGWPCTYSGTFRVNDGTVYSGINTANGCRGTGIPGMVEFCVDRNKYRAHFKWSSQKDKRCLKRTRREYFSCGITSNCWEEGWSERDCDW